MLSRATIMQGYTLRCLDGEIGTVRDFYWDDHFWTVRYLVVDTGHWLAGRRVLIAPYALRTVDPASKSIKVHLTKKQIEHSPTQDRDKPVSRQFEEAHYLYYGWPAYWEGGLNWGGTPEMEHLDVPVKNAPGGKALDAHLRSAVDLYGHHVLATDGEIGHIQDLVIDDQTWAIRYLIVDTRNWWPGKKVLIAPSWIGKVSWAEQAVTVTHTRHAIQAAPEYTGDALLTRSYESGLHTHYGRPGYWEAVVESAKASRRNS